MKIWCTVIRKNGSYQTVGVKAGAIDFELDKHIYFVGKYCIGKIGPMHILRSFYLEGLPQPLDIDIDAESKKAKLKIDSKAIRNLTEKRILSVFTDAELSRIEQILIIIVGAAVALSFATLMMILQVLDKLSALM